VVDCIDNYMFLDDHSCDALNHVVPLSYDHSHEEETAIVGDQELVSKEQGGHLFARREAFTEENPGPLKQPEFCHIIHDPLAIYMESYVSNFLKFSNGIISPILTSEYGFMKDFQDQTIEHFPLFIKEKHWVEIIHHGPAEDTEQHVKEELSVQFFSCPEPVNEQISLGISQPTSVLHPLVHSKNIKRRVSHNEGHELISCQLSSPDYKFFDLMGLYMELCFPKALEPAELFTLSSFGGMFSVPSHVSFCCHTSLVFGGSSVVKRRIILPGSLGGYGRSFLSPSAL
jgi:hypothetical protein